MMKAPIGMMTMARMGKWKSMRRRKSTGANPFQVIFLIAVVGCFFKYILILGVIIGVFYLVTKLRK